MPSRSALFRGYRNLKDTLELPAFVVGITVVIVAVVRQLLGWAWESQLMLGVGVALMAMVALPRFARTPLFSDITGFLRFRHDADEEPETIDTTGWTEVAVFDSSPMGRVESLERTVDELVLSVGSFYPHKDAEANLAKLHVSFKRALFEPERVQRSVDFVFRIQNYSDVDIVPTGGVRGNLLWEGIQTFRKNHFSVALERGYERIPTNHGADLIVTWIPPESFWENMASKVKGLGHDDVTLQFGFSNVQVEMRVFVGDGSTRPLGFMSLADRADIEVADNRTLRAIRGFVAWREGKFSD